MAQTPKLIGSAGTPATGAESTVTLGAEGPYLIKSIHAPFAAGVTAGNRTFDFTFTLPSGEVFYKCGNTTAVTASDAGVVQAIPAPDQSTYGTANFNRYCALPPKGLHVPSGTVIKTVTASIQTTDEYDVVAVMGYKRVLEIV